MNDTSKRILERVAYVVFFVIGILVIRAYKASNRPAPMPASAESGERRQQQEELRKKLAEFKAKDAAQHSARVKRLGEAGAKAQEERCDAELMAWFQAAVDKKPDVKTPDCDE